MIKELLTAILCVCIFTTAVYAAIEDYLILGDIGPYKLSRPQAFFPGEPPTGGPREYDRSGILAATDHFPDHADKTYEVMYIGGNGIPSPTVQVTQHAGVDSDRWLLHEVEMTYQKARTLGATYAAPNIVQVINGNKILFMRGHYKWISNNVVVAIDFTDLTGSKPEPLEVVQAYLQKFPSTIPSTLVLDDAHKIQWIKDEMERRLWLCDKWFMQLQLGKVLENQTLQESVKSMNEFLDYREKYYGISAASEKNLLAGYLSTNNGTGIRSKLAEYKTWWQANKTVAISL
jgi:hypothetical protein